MSSECELRFELDHPRRNIVQTGAENAGRRLLHVENLSKTGVRTPIIWKPEIGMVEEVKELEADP